MTANEVIELAKVGPLRQLGDAIKNNTTALIGFLNLGMIELYKRFALETDEAMITLVDGKTIYKLDGTDPDVEMGEGTYLYLVAAYGEGQDTTDYSNNDMILPINVEDNDFSINTISFNKIQIPLVTPGAFVSIIYVSSPTKVTSATLDNELYVSEVYIEPILHYIGYMAHSSMDSEAQTESNVHYSRFEAACERVRTFGVGIAPDDIEMDKKFEQRGFA